MSHLQAGVITVSVVVIAAVQAIAALLGRWRRTP
jgi:hypothetical protein